MLLKAWISPYKGMVRVGSLFYGDKRSKTMLWVFDTPEALIPYLPHDEYFSRNPSYTYGLQLCY
jgi:hypothetical protein